MENFLEAVALSNKDSVFPGPNSTHASPLARGRSPLSPQSLGTGEVNDVTDQDDVKASEQRGTAEQVPTDYGRQAKRRKVSHECVVSLNITCHQKAMLPLRDRRLLRRYYQKAFESLQQINCRTIAKAYVKLVEPRKQVNYPYNGRKLIAGISRQLDPEMTKPAWWPHGVTHREPDHLPKAERVRLLVHILCELRDSRGITVAKLREADQSIRRQISPPDRLEVLDEIYRVREEEESYLDDHLHEQAVVYISRAHLPDEIDPKNAGSPMAEVMNADVNSVYKREGYGMESHTSVFPSTGAFFTSHTDTASGKGDHGIMHANQDPCPSAALPTPRILKDVHEGDHPFSVSIPSAHAFHHALPPVPLNFHAFPLRFDHEPNVSHGQQDQHGPDTGVAGHGMESCPNPYYFNF
ncbi:DUF2841 domain-containing protein [Aspergillus fischeri NRRL 181]|uniref:Subtelomeric hrmA-associated cluster protein AFUB-079030/YDR124W-like helical bundle domain-containing protein n=1 Tax=Neosartorya fischeri (strain ATCC 1020 / DSM 3700 / CBS 544.65 / FGSC A1164 / JCM 1740 / NRRL 181 / WB 181) TaxID=331117 RepID=A1DP83_NEOFI|nr:conserved hypothetical protein [Aspergillus fischeri NRRL 181]EAW16604.1 conserved hypothetical protein [Aspergillus fischeri NRRL 181]KAG2024412.1 hypothetical protein GB937_004069 [Aspergillus fischeri]